MREGDQYVTECAVEAEEAGGEGAGSSFRDAASIFQQSDREVRFVAASYWRENTDGDPTTFAMGQTVGVKGAVLLNKALGRGDLVVTATHEALVHVQNKNGNALGMHFGDQDAATDPVNRKAYHQLPLRLLPSAELWRRKLRP